MELYYLRNVLPEHALWDYLRHNLNSAHPALAELATRSQTIIGPHEARRVFVQLRDLGLRDDLAPSLRAPVELVTLDGEPVRFDALSPV